MFRLFDTLDMVLLQVGKSSKQQAAEHLAEQELLNLRARNEQRIAKIKADMGEKYILHPSHNKTRLDTPRPV